MRIVLAATILMAVLGVALFASFLAPYPLHLKNLSEQLATPSLAHWLGQNHHGEDLLTIIVYGARVSLLVGLVTTVISLTVGSLLGLLGGYFGGKIDSVLVSMIDVVLAFPGMLLAISIAAVMGPSLLNVILALTAGGWVSYARLVRSQTLSVRQRDFVTAACTLGAGSLRIVLRHIFPNLLAPLLVQASFGVASAILVESSLSFLGLGVPAHIPSWGSAVSDGARYLLSAPHLATFPGLAIMLTVFSLNFLGDGLRVHLHETD
jgi:peptide/nickel transport system permease protein